MSYRLFILGTAGTTISLMRAQTSFCLLLNKTTFIFDVGLTTPHKLLEINALKNINSLFIHISHRHIDHIGGLFPLLQSLTWADDPMLLGVETVKIYCTKEVQSILTSSMQSMGMEQFDLRGYYPERNRRLEIISYGNEDSYSYQVEDIKMKSVHLPITYNHGVKFRIENKQIALTGDATEYGERYLNFCKGADIIIFDLGHLTTRLNKDHTFTLNLDSTISLLAECKTGRFIATHLTLRHLEHKVLSVEGREQAYIELIGEILCKAREKGFMGSLELGEDLMEVFQCSDKNPLS